MSDPLLEYSRTLLNLVDGAVDERGDDLLDVLLPDAVSELLELPTEATLAFGARVPKGATKVGLESDWLSRSARLLGSRGARLEVTLPPRSPHRIKPEALLDSQLELPNATWRLIDLHPAQTRYIFITVRYSAISDDRRDGILNVGFNVGTGAYLGMEFEALRMEAERALRSPASMSTSMDGAEDAAPRALDAEALQNVLHAAVGPRARRALGPFVAGLERRLARDAERLVGYHQRLLEEVQQKHEKELERAARAPDKTEAPPSPRARATAIIREFRATIEDLEQKFALEVEVTPIRVLDVIASVQRIEIDILRRKNRRRIAIDYCTEARRLEPLRCEDGWTETRRRLACDAQVHLVSEAGLAACTGCGSSYCHVCHPRACPRCKRKKGR